MPNSAAAGDEPSVVEMNRAAVMLAAGLRVLADDAKAMHRPDVAVILLGYLKEAING